MFPTRPQLPVTKSARVAAGSDWLVLQLRLFTNGLTQALLQLYCRLRKRRESSSPDSWLLLTLLPPAGAFLAALLLSLFAGKAAIALIVVALLYAMAGIYVSLGPTTGNAEARVATVRARWQELRTRCVPQGANQRRSRLPSR